MRPIASLLLLSAVAATAGMAPAQMLIPAGLSARAFANAYTRGGAGMNAAELLQRFDADLLQGYGVETSTDVFVVRGVAVQVRDFGFSVPNGLVDITLYTEDPQRPDYPDLTSPLGGLAGVSPGGLPLAYTLVVFPVPVLVPAGRDLFVGVRINATSSQIAGTRLNYLPGVVSAVTHDLPGAGLPTTPAAANSFRLLRDLVTNELTYQARGQYMMDLLTRSPGGCPTALTNQANYTISGSPPGATTLMSGLHPDAASPPVNTNREDDVGFAYTDPGLAAGMPVAFTASFAGFGPIVPLATLVPGSVGGCCIGSSTSTVLGIAVLDEQHFAYLNTTVPDFMRPMLRGTSWVQQAFGLDTSAVVLRGSQCGRQRF